MKKRTAEAFNLEESYLDRLKELLVRRDPLEKSEIIQNVKEHIEEALLEFPDSEIRLESMSQVLERLGSPETFVQNESLPKRDDQGSSSSAITKSYQSQAILGTCCVLLILASMFMPWGNLPTRTSEERMQEQVAKALGSHFGNGEIFFNGKQIDQSKFFLPESLEMNGWNGSLTILNIKIPNWILLVVAVLVVSMEWIKLLGNWMPSFRMMVMLLGYGLFHCFLGAFILISNGRGIGAGILLAFISFFAWLILTIKKKQNF